MADYQQSLTINAPANQILEFVGDIRNMPKYLPTTKNAEAQGEGRVRVQGEAKGHKYDSDGFLRRLENRLEWGADEGYYSGFLTVEPSGNDSSNVTVSISLNGTPPGADPNERPSDEQINEGLRKGLESINNFVTGQGGKEKPSVEP